MHFAQFGDAEVRVDLRGRKRGVAELLLHEAKVRSIGKEMRRARMAQLVRGKVRGQAGEREFAL